jgi:hypothetical protein
MCVHALMLVVSENNLQSLPVDRRAKAVDVMCFCCLWSITSVVFVSTLYEMNTYFCVRVLAVLHITNCILLHVAPMVVDQSYLHLQTQRLK